jgi:hypothetical protein
MAAFRVLVLGCQPREFSRLRACLAGLPARLEYAERPPRSEQDVPKGLGLVVFRRFCQHKSQDATEAALGRHKVIFVGGGVTAAARRIAAEVARRLGLEKGVA